MNVPVVPVGFGDIVEYPIIQLRGFYLLLTVVNHASVAQFLFVASCESECREEQKSCLSYLYFHCLTLSV